MNLENLAEQVHAYAKRCCDDLVINSLAEIGYTVLDMNQIFEDELLANEVGFRIVDADDSYEDYLFTDWSRNQLLSHLGCRAKWFDSVTLVQQVDELTVRRECLDDMVLKSMHPPGPEAVRVVRGLVSKDYLDLPDTEIVDALLELGGDREVIKHLSGKTSKGFYAYIYTSEGYEQVPNTSLKVRPGLALRNSEVGYTSMTLEPFVLCNGRVALLKNQRLASRIHRGKNNDLHAKLSEGLEKAKGLWGTHLQKLNALHHYHYNNGDEARQAMREHLTYTGATKRFMQKCCSNYDDTCIRHSMATVFEAVMASLDDSDKDLAFLQSRVAGSLLLRLVGK